MVFGETSTKNPLIVRKSDGGFNYASSRREFIRIPREIHIPREWIRINGVLECSLSLEGLECGRVARLHFPDDECFERKNGDFSKTLSAGDDRPRRGQLATPRPVSKYLCSNTTHQRGLVRSRILVVVRLAGYRADVLGARRVLYVTDMGQSSHFEQVFQVARRSGTASFRFTCVRAFFFGTMRFATGKRVQSFVRRPSARRRFARRD